MEVKKGMTSQLDVFIENIGEEMGNFSLYFGSLQALKILFSAFVWS